MSNEILQQILDELKTFRESQNLMQKDIKTIKESQNLMQEDINSMQEDMNSMQKDIKLVQEKQNSMQSDILEIKNKVNVINEQTVELTEFHIETNTRLDKISDDLDFLTHKEFQTEKEIFKLKRIIAK